MDDELKNVAMTTEEYSKVCHKQSGLPQLINFAKNVVERAEWLGEEADEFAQINASEAREILTEIGEI